MVIDYHDGENGHNKIEKIYCKIFSFAIHNTKQYCKKILTIPQYNMSIYNRVPTHGHQQPKCNNNFVCSHGEAPWIWVDSVKNSSPCSFVPCSSEQNWNSGACTSCGVAGCKKMGWDSTKPRSNTKYYGNTRSSAPYC